LATLRRWMDSRRSQATASVYVFAEISFSQTRRSRVVSSSRNRTAVRRTAAPRLRSQALSNRATFNWTALNLRVGSIVSGLLVSWRDSLRGAPLH
jgi:hypothetical protein